MYYWWYQARASLVIVLKFNLNVTPIYNYIVDFTFAEVFFVDFHYLLMEELITKYLLLDFYKFLL